MQLDDGVQARGTRAGFPEFTVTAAQFEELGLRAEAAVYPSRLQKVEA